MMTEQILDAKNWPSLGANSLLPVDEPESSWEVLPSAQRTLHHCVSSPDLRRYSLSEEEDDFSLVSEQPAGLSFRDALQTVAVVEEDSAGEEAPVMVQAPPRKFKPKFVVKPIRRCSKSTGDLRGLLHSVAEEEEEVLGASDAGEFYHRKAQGAKGRANGLKLRPDEAKRREMTLYKKEQQRQR